MFDFFFVIGTEGRAGVVVIRRAAFYAGRAGFDDSCFSVILCVVNTYFYYHLWELTENFLYMFQVTRCEKWSPPLSRVSEKTSIKKVYPIQPQRISPRIMHIQRVPRLERYSSRWWKSSRVHIASSNRRLGAFLQSLRHGNASGNARLMRQVYV